MVAHAPGIPKEKNSRVINRSPVFYGWVIWAVGALAIIAAAPGTAFTFSLFNDHYIAEFGISRTQLSVMVGLGTFFSSFGIAWIGKQIDRHGNRSVGVVVTISFILVLVASSMLMGMITLFFSFFLLRLTGISMNVLGSTAIAGWWEKKRGLFVGLSLIPAALFRWQYLPILQSTIDKYGWRTTWVILGISIAVTILPLWFVFMRNRPEEYGLLPDGESCPPPCNAQETLDQQTNADQDWTLSEARRTFTFWIFLIARASTGVIGAGFVFHQVSVLAQGGYTADEAAAAFGTVALISVGMTVVVGWLITRVRPGAMLAMQQLLMIGVLIFVTTLSAAWMFSAFIVLFGMAWGFGGTIDGTIWADLYGRTHHGTIRGFTTNVHMIGTAIGLVVYGISYDLFDSYQPIAFVGVTLLLIEATLCFCAKTPQKSPQIAP